ncbi:hypothetical protein [Dictyobacter aurantiacus]|uniref:Uncharacterized protein n=1 Tax=Dictyobacter aurantiacus TaxID=1936993 RepID=A0A401Z9G0_9CHLR|nr:hypothetical protein [Dictyobacter aurantiacus]GCE03507.1 hypothetical protein KDAU_08360 [Dictyobacter aurantiacus]
MLRRGKAGNLPNGGQQTQGGDDLDRNERAFGADSDMVQALDAAVDDCIMERSGLDGLSTDARLWLEHPTMNGPFSEYWQSGRFPADQVLNGMTHISNITITDGEDGAIDIEFDYESDVDGYEVSGHVSA